MCDWGIRFRKSSLVNEVLRKALARKLNRNHAKPGEHKEIKGIENLEKSSISINLQSVEHQDLIQQLILERLMIFVIYSRVPMKQKSVVTKRPFQLQRKRRSLRGM